MRTSSINVVAVGVGLLSRLVAGRGCEGPSEALQWFNYGVPVPVQCVAQLQAQATDFCRSYRELDPVTVYLSTATPDASPVTVSVTITTSTTSTEEVVTMVPVTSYVTETDTTTKTLIATTYLYLREKRGYVPPLPVCGLNPASCLDPATDCIDLSASNFRRRSAGILDEYCDCLGIPVETVTADVVTATVSTSTATQTAVETDVVVETTTETVLTLTIITEVAMETETMTYTTTVTNMPGR